MAAVLFQVVKGKELVACYSKSFNSPQKNYCLMRRKLLDVVLAVSHFRPYLYTQRFRLLTDYASLI